MSRKIPDENVAERYLKTLEEVKKQYQRYVEISELYDLPASKKEEAPQYQPPSHKHPLTTNTFRVK